MSTTKKQRDVPRRGDGVAPDELTRPMIPLDAEPFCRRIYPKLVGALSLSYGDRYLAEELAQEALSRVLERWGRVSGLDDPDGYTFRTAFNLGRSRWRRGLAERRAQQREGPTSEEAPGDDGTNNLAVRKALQKLTERQRDVIVHRFFIGHSVKETAAALGCAEGTVKAHTAHAIDALRVSGLVVADD